MVRQLFLRSSLTCIAPKYIDHTATCVWCQCNTPSLFIILIVVAVIVAIVAAVILIITAIAVVTVVAVVVSIIVVPYPQWPGVAIDTACPTCSTTTSQNMTVIIGNS